MNCAGKAAAPASSKKFFSRSRRGRTESLPDTALNEFFLRGLAPIVTVRFRAGRTRMQDLPDAHCHFFRHQPAAFLRKRANANQPFRLENSQHAAQMLVANFK